jgi:hypothetical protein
MIFQSKLLTSGEKLPIPWELGRDLTLNLGGYPNKSFATDSSGVILGHFIGYAGETVFFFRSNCEPNVREDISDWLLTKGFEEAPNGDGSFSKFAGRKVAEVIGAEDPHRFKPARWTFPNGHPRCLICGDEEMEGGMCRGRGKTGALDLSATERMTPLETMDIAKTLGDDLEELVALAFENAVKLHPKAINKEDADEAFYQDWWNSICAGIDETYSSEEAREIYQRFRSVGVTL